MLTVGFVCSDLKHRKGLDVGWISKQSLHIGRDSLGKETYENRLLPKNDGGQVPEGGDVARH